nr:MAG: replication initiator protein [Microviridae sp.]
MNCLMPVLITKNLDQAKYPKGLEVPCGKCLNCRIRKRKEWGMRCLHELSTHENIACFVTLTYDDQHIPWCKSLVKSDLQKFFKRLRKSLEPTDRKIRYFACGEYGDITQRPHYHMIIFGLSLSPTDKKYIISAWPFCDWNNPHILHKSFGIAEPDSINYVSAYIEKKLSGKLGIKEYAEQNRESVFKISSLGIGRDYAYTNAESIKINEYLTMNGTKMSIPRYYLKKLEIEVDKFNPHILAKQKEVNNIYTGHAVPDSMLELLSDNRTITKLKSKINDARKQHDKNLQARIDNKTSKKTKGM